MRGVVEARKASRAAIEASPSPVVLDDIPMPNWLSKTDVSACLDALGSFYLRKGNAE